MKLYRGLKEDRFKRADRQLLAEHQMLWRDILKARSRGRQYPEHLDSRITKLYRESKLYRQAFTDCRVTAARYGGAHGGALIELEVPEADVLKYFELDIQNYGRRRLNFEIVYTIEAKVLQRFMQAWNFRIIKIND